MSAEGRAKSVRDQIKAVIDAEGVTLSRARVHAVNADGTLVLQREGNMRPDGSWPPDSTSTRQLDPSQRVAVGDYVEVAHTGGHALVLGRYGKPGDKNIADLEEQQRNLATYGYVNQQVGELYSYSQGQYATYGYVGDAIANRPTFAYVQGTFSFDGHGHPAYVGKAHKHSVAINGVVYTTGNAF